MTVPAWVILASYAAAIAGYAVIRAVRGRRADRDWAAGVAASVHDGEYLRWLEDEFAKSDGRPFLCGRSSCTGKKQPDG